MKFIINKRGRQEKLCLEQGRNKNISPALRLRFM